MRKSAFTLIELMIAVTIVAIIAGIFALNVSGNLAKARDSKRKSDLRALKTSLDLYYNVNNIYPPSDSTWPPYSGDNRIKGCGALTAPTNCSWGTPWIQDGVTYMGMLPKDPKSQWSYFYLRAPQGRLSYIMVAKLERSFDPDTAVSQNNCQDTTYGFVYSDPSWYVMCDAR